VKKVLLIIGRIILGLTLILLGAGLLVLSWYGFETGDNFPMIWLSIWFVFGGGCLISYGLQITINLR
jgi:hypothetical protein